MKRNNQRGFTLLELIVVSVIVGLLAALAIPQYARYKDNAERASMLSDARSLYRAFVIYYLEYQEYPLADTPDPHKLNLQTFTPLTDTGLMAGVPLDIDIERFRDKLAGRQAEEFDSPDDIAMNQEFYLILPWAKDPNIKFVVAAADNVRYNKDDASTTVDGGNWMDGVFITKDKTIIGP